MPSDPIVKGHILLFLHARNFKAKDSEAIEAPESSFVQETGLEIVVV
jgi:hypothetical protein